MTDKLRIIRKEDYEPFATALKHVYLTGDLQRPPPNPFARDGRVEMVLCFYEEGDDAPFHWHSEVTEYDLVIEGELAFVNAADGETLSYGPGDLCVIPAGTCINRLVRRPARTVTMKVPSLSHDKVECPDCERDCAFRTPGR